MKMNDYYYYYYYRHPDNYIKYITVHRYYMLILASSVSLPFYESQLFIRCDRETKYTILEEEENSESRWQSKLSI